MQHCNYKTYKILIIKSSDILFIEDETVLKYNVIAVHNIYSNDVDVIILYLCHFCE